MDPVRVFVGTDRSQMLAVKVLEHSIKRHTDLQVELTAMCDLPIRSPKDPKNGQRTGFSFSRFCIPKMAEYKGRAIYLDADMLVMKDIRELWEMPFNGSKVIIQEDLSPKQEHTARKPGAPEKRIRQCAVMILDCGRLDWKIDDIIDGFDQNKYNYAELMYNLCLLDETEIRHAIPFRWNSLEHLDESTCLLHYTDMATQPWASPLNRNAEVWLKEVQIMIDTGKMTLAEIEHEIDLGHFRPSLLRDLRWGAKVPRSFKSFFNKFNLSLDNRLGFHMHKAVYEAKLRREAATVLAESLGKKGGGPL